MAIPRWWRLVARIRGVATRVGLSSVLVAVVGGVAFSLPGQAIVALTALAFGALLVSVALTVVPLRPVIAAREVGSPVQGRWYAVNSPATRVPSHGTHGYGQTYAIDLAYEPEPGARPAFGDGPAFRPPTDYPAFGEPIHAPADGVVVAARDRKRDHRSRSSWLAYGYLMLEGAVREFVGSGSVIGNHVVIDLGGGVYAVLAHLRRGSVTVQPGERVHRGQPVAQCGNSGNSSEPHLHFQLMDHRWPLVAAGLPFMFAGVEVPPTGQAMRASVG